MKNFTSRVSPKNVVALCMLLLSVFGVLKNETAKGQQLVGSYIYYVTLGGSTWIGTTDSFAMCSSTTSYDMTDFVNIAFDHYPSDPGTLTTTSVQIVTITAPANGTITLIGRSG